MQGHPSTYERFGEAWAFYWCEELGVAFFYCDTSPRIGEPARIIDVLCVALGRDVELEYLGDGDEGYRRVLEHEDDQRMKALVPVNLFDRPHRIDPVPSRTFSEQDYDDWIFHMAVLKGDL